MSTQKIDSDRPITEVIASDLHTAVVGDILDRLGFQNQFLPPEIRGLTKDMIVCGYAMPVIVERVNGTPAKPFGRLTEALDALNPGEVYLLNNAGISCAGWGEVLTTTAKVRGAAGAVIDGFHRDTRQVLQLDWPVFSRGSYSQDAGARASVVDFRCATQIGQVSVSPGDVVFGDIDGVVIIPQSILDEVVQLSLEKLSKESETIKSIRTGMTATSAYEKFGVL